MMHKRAMSCKLSDGLLTVGLFLAWASLAHADDTAKAIIEKAIKAHGADKLAKLKVRQEKTKHTSEVDGETATSASDSLVRLPDRFKSTTEVERKGNKDTNILVINVDKGWLNFRGETTEYTVEQVKSLKARLYKDYLRTLTPLIKDKGFTLSPLGEIKVIDRPALGVKVAAKDHGDVNLYFDKETGLLVKSEVMGRVMRQEVVLATVYSGCKVTHGLKWPMKMVDYLDGKQFRESEITKLQFLDKIDDSEFAKP